MATGTSYGKLFEVTTHSPATRSDLDEADSRGPASSRPVSPSRPGWMAGMEAAALAMAGALATLLAYRLAGGQAPWIAILAGLAVGYGLADLVSGLVHWLFDRAFEETTPLLGAAFVRPFREHHADPLAITRHGFLELNGNNALSVLPALLAGVAIPASSGAWGAFAQATALGLGVGVVLTNQFHQWAHSEGPPRIARWLQSHRLILPPEAHAHHHSGRHTKSYCVTTGWMNTLLDGMQLFAILEGGLRRLGIPGPHFERARLRS